MVESIVIKVELDDKVCDFGCKYRAEDIACHAITMITKHGDYHEAGRC